MSYIYIIYWLASQMAGGDAPPKKPRGGGRPRRKNHGGGTGFLSNLDLCPTKKTTGGGTCFFVNYHLWKKTGLFT